MVPNEVANAVLYENAKRFFPIHRTQEELDYAREFVSLATPQGMKMQRDRAARVYKGEDKSELTADVFSFLVEGNEGFGIVSDIGDVSYVVPLSYIMITTTPVGLPNHTWKTVTVGKGPIMHTAVLTAGKCLASASVDFMMHPEKVAQARAELQRKTEKEGYPYPLPKDLKPQFYL